jgi:hypothetical protein
VSDSPLLSLTGRPSSANTLADSASVSERTRTDFLLFMWLITSVVRHWIVAGCATHNARWATIISIHSQGLEEKLLTLEVFQLTRVLLGWSRTLWAVNSNIFAHIPSV